MTPRSSRIAGIDSVVVFGIQYFVQRYLIEEFQASFFSVPKATAIARYKRRLDTSLGPDAVDLTHIAALWDLGYLPVCIKAMPEGSRCKLRVPFLTIYNTCPEFAWVTNFLETIMSVIIWGPVTSTTIAAEYRKILNKFAAYTSDIPEFVQWQGHDFSMRGMFGFEAACMSGAGHLLSFTGTDTIPAIDFLEQYYYADADEELIGGSVPATEHSVMCMGGCDGEYETIKRLITETYPKGIISIVSDTWDYWHVLTDTLPKLKEEIMARDGKLTIRPDSGNPAHIICGDDMGKGAIFDGTIQTLWNSFGGVTNSKGFKQLDPHVGCIYGDSITLERCYEICKRLQQAGFASTNMVYGIGSYTYQYTTRDTFGIAVKATYGEIYGKGGIEIWKSPKTDSGVKNSARGLLCVDENGNLIESCSWEQERGGQLQTVFLNGQAKNIQTLSMIRKKLNGAVA